MIDSSHHRSGVDDAIIEEGRLRGDATLMQKRLQGSLDGIATSITVTLLGSYFQSALECFAGATTVTTKSEILQTWRSSLSIAMALRLCAFAFNHCDGVMTW